MKTKRPKSKWTADVFNGLFPIGTRVRYFPVLPSSPDYPSVETVTRSAAWELGHGEPVVMIEGKSGGVALSHIEIVE